MQSRRQVCSLRLGTPDFRGSCGRQSLQPNIPNRQAEALPEQEVLVWPIVSMALCLQPPVLPALLQLEAQGQLIGSFDWQQPRKNKGKHFAGSLLTFSFLKHQFKLISP